MLETAVRWAINSAIIVAWLLLAACTVYVAVSAEERQRNKTSKEENADEHCTD